MGEPIFRRETTLEGVFLVDPEQTFDSPVYEEGPSPTLQWTIPVSLAHELADLLEAVDQFVARAGGGGGGVHWDDATAAIRDAVAALEQHGLIRREPGGIGWGARVVGG